MSGTRFPLDRLMHLRWDGNIRMLEKCLETACLKTEGQVITWKDAEK